MLSWLTSKERDHEKIMQMWAFKTQYPMIKPQFAMGVYGGQGIGKNVVLEEFPSRILGASVKSSSAKQLFGDRFSLQTAIGASLLIVNEVKDLGDFELAKDLHRSERHEIDVKYGEKGDHRLFCIPVYLSQREPPELPDCRRDRSHAVRRQGAYHAVARLQLGSGVRSFQAAAQR